VLLLTSDSEGMPNVVLEAMAASVPVVSTPVGDLPDALSGRCGVVVAPDADRLAAATLEILANDRQWQPTFESDAREFVNRYSLPAMVVGTTTVWKETAARLR
jgi:glycosyltransferase involved in cell wall biosynthesis